MRKLTTGRLTRVALLAAIPLSLVGCVAIPDQGYGVHDHPAYTYSYGYSSGGVYYAPVYVRPPSTTIVIRPRPVVVVPAHPVRPSPHYRRDSRGGDSHGYSRGRGHGDGGGHRRGRDG